MILKSSIKSDVKNLLKYGKAKAIFKLNMLLPKLTPFKEIILVDSYEDLTKVLPNLPKNYFYRRDKVIGGEFGTRVPKDGDTKNIVNFFNNMKTANPDSALLILPSNVENLPRYISNGGFNVFINKNEGVVIELVGKGFDGRELTHGSVCHESYIIPWEYVLFCNNYIKLNKFCTHKTNAQEYKDAKKTRLNFLKKTNVNQNEIDKYLPNEYVAPTNATKDEILNEIVLPLFLFAVNNNNFQNCWICGNITHKDELIPFECSSLERINKLFINAPKNSNTFKENFSM